MNAQGRMRFSILHRTLPLTGMRPSSDSIWPDPLYVGASNRPSPPMDVVTYTDIFTTEYRTPYHVISAIPAMRVCGLIISGLVGNGAALRELLCPRNDIANCRKCRGRSKIVRVQVWND